MFSFKYYYSKVYVAGKNRLYQLDSNLNLIKTVITGPKPDSKDCNDKKCNQIDNINKVLLIDDNSFKYRLIICGTVFQGACSTRTMEDISLPEQNVVEKIVPNGESERCNKTFN